MNSENNWLLEIPKFIQNANINGFCAQIILRFFKENGLFENTNPHTAETIANTLKLPEEKKGLIKLLLEFLSSQDIISQNGSSYTLIKSAPLEFKSIFSQKAIEDAYKNMLNTSLLSLLVPDKNISFGNKDCQNIYSRLHLCDELLEKVILITAKANIDRTQNKSLTILAYSAFSESFFAQLNELCQSKNIQCQFFYDAGNCESIQKAGLSNVSVSQYELLAEDRISAELKHSVDIFISKHLTFNQIDDKKLVHLIKSHLQHSGVIIAEESAGFESLPAISLPLRMNAGKPESDEMISTAIKWGNILNSNNFVDINQIGSHSNNTIQTEIWVAQNNELEGYCSSDLQAERQNKETAQNAGPVNTENLAEEIRTALAGLLELSPDQIDMEQDLIELGMDSILAAELGVKLSEQYNIKLNPSVFFTVNTGNKVVETLRNDYISAAVPEEPELVPEPQITEPADQPQIQNSASLYEDIQEIIAELLEIEASAVDMTQDLVELGMDSILAAELGVKVSARFGISINPSLFFTVNTGEKLIESLKDEYGISEGAQKPDEEVIETKHASEQNSPQRVSSSQPDAIAIVGCSGRFPQSENIAEFWKHIKNGNEALSDLPVERWENSQFKDTKIGDKKTKLKAGIMPNADSFDNLFFNIPKQEAEITDPKQRILLETVWHAIEDAGYKASDLRGTKTGVFVGFENNEFAQVSQQVNEGFGSENASCMLANKLSYHFDLRGESMVVDSACGSSLSAMQSAIRSLQAGDTELAIVSGVSVLYSPTPIKKGIEAGWISAKGKCAPFDETATGWLVGEGAGSVILKPLGRAIANNDNIYAVIKGSAITHSGKTNAVGVPNPQMIGETATDAIKKAGISKEEISYIETHGLGIKLIDAAEIEGLRSAFTTESEEPCYIGSLTANFGNLEPVSGLAGVIKLLLALKHKTIPKNINFNKQSPFVNFNKTAFTIPTAEINWQAKTENGSPLPRLCAINNFGYGGVNSFFIFEEFMQSQNQLQSAGEKQLFILSARNKTNLKKYCSRYTDFLSEHENINIADMLYTQRVGREEMKSRLAIVFSDRNDLIAKLKLAGSNKKSDSVYFGETGSDSAGKITGDQLTGILQNKIEELAESWISGNSFAWGDYYKNRSNKRISLPAYPFEIRPFAIIPQAEKTKEAETIS